MAQGVCNRCGKRRVWGNFSTHTLSSSERGYDSAWRKLRKTFIIEQTRQAIRQGQGAYPICAACHKPIDGVVHCDHIISFVSLSDPKRLDINNLRAMHPSCHMRAENEKS